jgi:phage terminase large subunit GpA-like protein
MDALNDPLIHSVAFMKSAQVGATEALCNIIGFHVDQDPAPILVVMPTVEMGQAYSKDRLAPMIRDTPALRGRIHDSKSRDSGNTMLHKIFDGGHITITGANSPAGLAMRPVRITLFDEIDRYPASAGAEGDPVNLGRKRSTTFWNRKSFEASTPTIKNMSRIEASYEASDMRRYYVPCPHCDEFQTLKWSQVSFDPAKPGDAVYVCEHCAAIITDTDKPTMLRNGEWRADKPCAGIAGFHINELYSPWVTFGDMATSFIEAKRLPETLKTWVNTALAETWEEDGEGAEPSLLYARREPYSEALVPAGALVLVAGADIQKDRIEVEVVGYGLEYESWGVEVKILFGDTSQPNVWKDFDQFLKTEYAHASGLKIRIASAGVDQQYLSTLVQRFCKSRAVRRIYPVRGMAGGGRPIVGKPSRNNAQKVNVFQVGTDTAKDLLFSRLQISDPGPGYCHFPATYNETYFEQLTAERAVTKYVKGKNYRAWVKNTSGARVEALDRRVYSLAALELANVNMQALAAEYQARAVASPPPQKTPTRRRRMASTGIKR